MKLKFFSGLAFAGILLSIQSAAAVDFSVDDPFAGAGALDLSVPVQNSEGFTWMGPVTWDTEPFSGVGQFPDGDTWSGGNISHSHFGTDTGAPFFTPFTHFRMDLTLTGLPGVDLITEELNYNAFFPGGHKTIVDPTITILGLAAGLPITFPGTGLPPGDDGDGDFAYLLQQAGLD